MMRRVVWFVGGVATGAAGAGAAKRKLLGVVRRTSNQLAPANVARGAADTARRSGRRITDAVREGRAASQQRQRELRAELDGRIVRLSDHLHPGDEVLVDGTPVDTGRVIVLRQPK